MAEYTRDERKYTLEMEERCLFCCVCLMPQAWLSRCPLADLQQSLAAGYS
jgi:hypothetical protein